ncbi:hypothetical protein [Pseudarthrobacter sp. ATCC 49987]|uniref:hypothetical protein n=1 Tax=Pseudarthrobacter sp. ATCC 49987 TaxID=2698204 RepID=UPI0013686DAE|nr:hypothetical protein [Pseudarthrobacter sp. ATCC 49987]
MSTLDFRPIPLDWARHMTKLWILERSTTETSPTTLITHTARLCTDFIVQCAARQLSPPTSASDLTREHGKVLAQALAGMTRLDGKPLANSYKRFLGSTVTGMIDYARKNSDLFENTTLSFSLDYDLRIPSKTPRAQTQTTRQDGQSPNRSSSTSSNSCPRRESPARPRPRPPMTSTRQRSAAI